MALDQSTATNYFFGTTRSASIETILYGGRITIWRIPLLATNYVDLS